MGEILSPKNAPETTAPAVIATGIPSPSPTPIAATPIVPIVVQELQVINDITLQNRKMSGRNQRAERTLNPKYIRTGTIPLAIHTPMSIPMINKISNAGIVLVIDCLNPSRIISQWHPFA